MSREQIVYKKVSALKNNPNNPRKNDDAVGSNVFVRKVMTLHEKTKFYEEPRYCNIWNYEDDLYCADCYTSTDFVEKTKIKEPCVFDMELAFIRALFNDVTAIKVVSDKLSLKQYKTEINKNKGENQ